MTADRVISFSALAAVLLLAATTALAHGGGLDRYGCHNNRKTGGYHCHRGSLAGRSFSSQAAMLRELQGGKSRPPAEAPPPKPQGIATEPLDSGGSSGLSQRVAVRDLFRTAQNLLLTLGYDPGPATGEVTLATADAIREFQRDRGLSVDGLVTGRLLVELSGEVRRRR